MTKKISFLFFCWERPEIKNDVHRNIIFRRGADVVILDISSLGMVFLFSRMNIWPWEAVNQTENTFLRSCTRDSSLVWNYFHHVLYFFIGNLKNRTRIKTDYDGFGDLLLAPYWLTGVFCFFLLSFFFNWRQCSRLLVFLHLFYLLMCSLFSFLIFMTFSSGSMLFFMSLFNAEVICSQSFSCKISQCVCSFDFLCWYLAFLTS